MTVFERIARAYAALTGKATIDPNSPLGRLHPGLTTREHLTGWPGWVASETADDYVGYARVYEVYVWMRKAITVIVENVAPLPVRVVGADGTPISNHPLASLLTQPNQQMDSAELWSIAWTHKLLGGEWFLEAVDARRPTAVPAELWPRRPDKVGVAPDEAQENYPVPAGYEVEGIKALLPPDAVIHEKFLNPLNDWRGLSPASAVREGVTIDLYAQGYSKRFLKGNARPDYAIESKMALTPPEIERMEAQIVQKYGSGQGGTKPMVLEGGQTIHVLSFPPKDTEYLAQREMSREEVGSLYGVPDEIMGWGRDTYENFDTALRVFWLLTLLPMVQRRDATLTNFFTLTRKVLRPGERIATDLSGVSVLQESLGPKVEQAKSLWAMGVPYNVLDQTLKLGTGPIPGGDVGYLPMNLIPAPQVGLVPPTPTSAAGPAQTPTLRRHRIAAKSRASQTGEELRRIRLEVAGRLEPEIDLYQQALADRVVARVEAQQQRSIRRNGHGPALLTVKALTVEGLLLPEDEDLLKALFERYTIEIARASWDTWNTSLGVQVIFDQTDPAVVAALAHAGDRVSDITETTRQFLAKVLQDGADAGLTDHELIPGIRLVIEESYKGRARTIARTEMGYAQANAAAARYEAAGVDRVLIFDNGLEDSDPVCQTLNGTIQTLEWYKRNQLQHPNCLRSAGPYYED